MVDRYNLIFYTYDDTNGLRKHHGSTHNGGYSLDIWSTPNGIICFNTMGKSVHALCDWHVNRIGRTNYYLLHKPQNKNLLVKVVGNIIVTATKDEITLCHDLINMIKNQIQPPEGYTDILITKGLEGVLTKILGQIGRIVDFLPNNPKRKE